MRAIARTLVHRSTVREMSLLLQDALLVLRMEERMGILVSFVVVL